MTNYVVVSTLKNNFVYHIERKGYYYVTEVYPQRNEALIIRPPGFRDIGEKVNISDLRYPDRKVIPHETCDICGGTIKVAKKKKFMCILCEVISENLSIKFSRYER